jgi:hypothetical protein
VIKARDERERQFQSEYTDSKWSDGATKSFREDLGGARVHSRYNVVGVECKMTLCLANIRWNSYHEARKYWESLMHESFRINCGKEIFLPAPENLDVPYQSQLYFDCTTARSE